jgi:hypothetical protein
MDPPSDEQLVKMDLVMTELDACRPIAPPETLERES